MIKYGQAFAALDAINIAPGFASMYRSRVLRAVEMNPPGVVIEDFNMTFEIHRHELGRIAFHPSAAVARTQDPATLHEYTKQVRRWALGFWQTVRLHGLFHPGLFWATLIVYTCELVVSALVLLATALLVTYGCLRGALALAGLSAPAPAGLPSAWVLLLVVVIPDFVLTCAVALGQRRALIFAAAPAYPVLRVLDAWLCLRSLVASFRTTSNGGWSSPTRRVSTPTGIALSADPTAAGGTA